MGKTFENDQPNHRAAFISWRWLAIAFFLIIVLAFGILIAINARGSNVDRGTLALIDAFSKQRLIEPRLSGGFKGSEFRASLDGAPDIKTAELARAQGLIMDAVAKGDPRAELAYARLLLSEGAKLPVALTYLRRAVKSAPDGADAHNDLGVCLILQGKLEDAISEFDAALGYNSQMNEALFNRALCYEKLQLRDAAAAGFAELAKIEQDGIWLREIGQRRERLAQPPRLQTYNELVASVDLAFAEGRIDDLRIAVERWLLVVSHHALIDLVKQYLQAAVANDRSKADPTLRELTVLGDMMAEIHDDFQVGDAVRYLKSLAENDLTTEQRLVDELVTAIKKNVDLATYERLRDEFGKRRNEVFQVLSGWYLARGSYLDYRYVESAAALRSILPVVLKNKWRHQHLLALSQLGLSISRLGQDSQAIAYFNECGDSSARMHDSEAKVLQNLSLPYWHIGDFDKAVSYLRDSIALTLPEGPLSELAYDYLQLADIYRQRDRHDLALLYATEAHKYADQAKHNRFGAQASSLMAIERARLNDFQKAGEDLQRAFEYLNAMGQEAANAYNRPLVLTRAAEVAVRSGDIPRALQYCDEAEKLVSAAEENKLPLVRVLRARAEALLAGGQPLDARANLERALEMLEGYRATIASSEDRSYFLETSQAVFDRIINLNLEGPGREAEAFDLSERSRARALLDDISSDANGPGNQSNGSTPAHRPRPAGLGALQQRLPADLTLVEYSVTDRGTFIFLVSRSEFRVAKSAADSTSIDQLVNDYLSDLRNPAARDDSHSRTELSAKAHLLYQQLIQPIGSLPKSGTRLCIVPDKSLHFLPFAALQDSKGEYLIQNYILTYAPSASVLLECSEQSFRRQQRGPEKTLAVGNPRIDRDYFHDLSDLEAAEQEALQSASFYTQPETLIGAAATKPRVLADIRGFDVVHFASHCLVNNSSPWRAALVLASTPAAGTESTSHSAKRSADIEKSRPEAHQEELLTLKEISELRLARTKLVVLSACQTGLGRYFKGEGIVSLVRPFIASGVPTVVASLWSVDSQSTYELMVRFHLERTSTTAGAGDALRAAQLKIMAGTFQHPYYWAAFIAVGT